MSQAPAYLERGILWGAQMDGVVGEEVPCQYGHGLRSHPIFRFTYLDNAQKGPGIKVKYIKFDNNYIKA